MTTAYDYTTAAGGNNAAAPGGFPETMLFSELNDTMRAHMARSAQRRADGGGGAGPLIQLQPQTATTVGVIDRSAAGAQTFAGAPPVGFEILFRVVTATVENPLWLSYGADVPRPVVYPTHGAVGANALLVGALYRAVFTGTTWQITSNTNRIDTARPWREATDKDGLLQLIATDVGGILRTDVDPLNGARTMTLNIRAGLVERWPIGGSVLVVSARHTDLYVTADADAPITLRNVVPSSGLAVSLTTRQVIVVRLVRVDALNIDVITVPRSIA